MSTSQSRKPKGTPTGGQFAEKAHPESTVTVRLSRTPPDDFTADGVEAVAAELAPLTQYGPNYDRGVASALADARLFLGRGELEAAIHFAQLARCRAGLISWDEFVALDPHRDGPRPTDAALLDAKVRSLKPGDVVTGAEAVRVMRAMPGYAVALVEFDALPGRAMRMMARDLPKPTGLIERRFTNLDTGTEYFVEHDDARIQRATITSMPNSR